MEVLLNFRTKCRYGPSFPCIVCHELKFRGQVSAIKLDEIEDEFVTGDFIRQQSKLFLKHGSFHICTPCKSKVSRGELPKLAARNSLNCPWDNVPKQFLTLNTVENSILAPNLLLANVHNVIPEASDSKRLVAVPVSTDEVGNRVSSVTDTSGTLNSMVQSNQINRPHGPSHVRGRLVKLAFAYLAGQQQNPYTVRDDENSANKIIQLEAFADERSLPDPVPLYDSDTELEVADLSADPVECNRNCLPQVKNVFIPDGNMLPGSFGCPVNFLDVRHPYVTTMPMFFPEGRFGLHDPDRVLPISEGEFVLHHMRNVRKELLYSPLFISTAVYRLETHRLISACHALRGYITSDNNVVEWLPDARLRFMKLVGSSDYYKKQYLEMKAKSAAFGFPQIFYTFTNTDRWEVTLASCLMQEGHAVWHVTEEEELDLLPGKEFTPTQEEYAVHTSNTGSSNCPFHNDCRRVNVGDFMSQAQMAELLNRNIYTVNRVFDQRARCLVGKVLSSSVNPIQVKAYHDVKEFGDARGWAHLHGVAWRKLDTTEAIFRKLHSGEQVSEKEKQDLAALAETVVCVWLLPDRISSKFPDLAGERASTIAGLATKYQCHGCTEKCERPQIVGCWYRFPREPSGLTLIAAPPPKRMPKEVSAILLGRASAVKKQSRPRLFVLTHTNCKG